MTEAAFAAADTAGLRAAVAVVDAGGHLASYARMDGVPYMAAEVARRKAVTAGRFGLPTHALAQVAASDPAAGADLAKDPVICQVAGGLPLRAPDGALVGGLGVAGGRADQDRAVAEAALAAWSTPASGDAPGA